MNTPEFKKHVINLLKEKVNTPAPDNKEMGAKTSDVKNIVKYIETKSDFISRLERVSNGQEVTEFLSFILNKINPKVSGVNKNALMNIIKDRFK
jgi:tetrahydromethanopterin S-methyltransferase subunit F